MFFHQRNDLNLCTAMGSWLLEMMKNVTSMWADHSKFTSQPPIDQVILMYFCKGFIFHKDSIPLSSSYTLSHWVSPWQVEGFHPQREEKVCYLTLTSFIGWIREPWGVLGVNQYVYLQLFTYIDQPRIIRKPNSKTEDFVKNQGCPRGKFVKTELRQVTAEGQFSSWKGISPHVFFIVVFWQKNKYQLQKQCCLKFG